MEAGQGIESLSCCPPCGAPVMEFLKERGLIEPEMLEYLERKEIMRQ
jgi:hypothetical protein